MTKSPDPSHTAAGAIATPHHLATRAGRRAFDAGGNAIDAAIAAATVLAVVYPHMCALGGDAQALQALPGGTVRALSGSGAAARAASAVALSATHATMPVHGVHPITVPGLVAAWGDLHAAGGRLPWSALFADAIALAEQGTPVAVTLGRDLQALQERVRCDPGLRGVFFARDGRVLKTGETLRQPALARSLTTLAERGACEFYEGELAATFVRGLQALGSPLDMQDLSRHRSEWQAPLTGPFGPWEVLTTPPVSPGHVLLQLLSALRLLGLERADPLGPEAACLVRLCALTAQERDATLADPRHVRQEVDAWLAAATIERLATHARNLNRPLPSAPQQPRPDGDTVAIVAQDAEGYAVTLIQSVFHSFGAGVLEPSTGIVCHNRGAAFTLADGPALLMGGRRPPSTLTASMLRQEGSVTAALGAMGGRGQPQILMQLLMRLASGQPASEALAAPRWVVGNYGQGDEIVVLAEGAVSDSCCAALATSGLPLVIGADQDDRAGHAQFVGRASMGTIDSATDPRADGAPFPA